MELLKYWLFLIYFVFFQVSEIFDDFEPDPLGAASLAQVHKAKLKDGTPVAVKVQHPKVMAHSFVDMATMEVSNVCVVIIIGWNSYQLEKNATSVEYASKAYQYNQFQFCHCGLVIPFGTSYHGQHWFR